MLSSATAMAPCTALPSRPRTAQLQPAARPARLRNRSVVAPRAMAKLERNLSSHSRCEIAHPDGYQAYCNVIRGKEGSDGSDGYQFVIVFMTEEGLTESADYEFYKSEWFSTLEECEKAVAEFDLATVLPKTA